MPRMKSSVRTGSEVCSDCGAPDTNWASVNRGIFMCNDCASVHMTLGRHVSQVKHLQKSPWHPNMLNMVNHLVSVGANSIWEHSLLDPAQMRSGKRKPNPSDHIHPTKSDFIKSKYLHLSYVYRLPCREEDHHTTQDISKQLHSSVRTANLETSLRLLSLGAQANFFNTEKGNTPLHVAAKVGQALQVELLVAYGADPSTVDINNNTPDEIARAENHTELADRLVLLKYELCDRLTNYVSGQVPDHKTGKHYVIPKSSNSPGMTIEGKRRMQALNNQTFEELAMDVFDEIDRRELELIWQDTQKGVLIPGKGPNPALQSEVVPFLPSNSDYSATRNQGRQKLGIFKDSELKSMVTDIITDIARRQTANEISREDPIYDVPPEEDLDYQSIEKSAIATPKEMVSKEDYLTLQQRLIEKEADCTKLQELNRELSDKVTTLAKQKHDLTRKLQNLMMVRAQPVQTNKPSTQAPAEILSPTRLGSSARPSSVYNPNDSSGSQSSLHSADSHDRRKTIHFEPNQMITSATTHNELREPLSVIGSQEKERSGNVSQCSTGSDYDNNGNTKEEEKRGKEGDSGTGSPEQSGATDATEEIEVPQNNVNANNNVSNAESVAEPTEEESAVTEPTEGENSGSSSPHSQVEDTESISWPERNALLKKTELLTRNIQTLLQTAQSKKGENYLECAENILSAVSEIVALFEKPHQPPIKAVLQLICASAHKLRNRCKEPLEMADRTNKQFTEEIIAYAYEIAKAEKRLVTMAPKDEGDGSSSSS